MNVEIDWKILVGQIINFAILFFVLKIFVYKPFLDLMKKRRETIEDGVNKSIEADKQLNKVQELRREMEKVTEDEKKKILSAAEAESKKRAEESMKKAEEERAALLIKAKKEAEDLKEKESEKTRKETVDNAFALAEKLLKENIDEKKGKQLTDEFLKKLKA